MSRRHKDRVIPDEALPPIEEIYPMSSLLDHLMNFLNTSPTSIVQIELIRLFRLGRIEGDIDINTLSNTYNYWKSFDEIRRKFDTSKNLSSILNSNILFHCVGVISNSPHTLSRMGEDKHSMKNEAAISPRYYYCLSDKGREKLSRSDIVMTIPPIKSFIDDIEAQQWFDQWLANCFGSHYDSKNGFDNIHVDKRSLKRLHNAFLVASPPHPVSGCWRVPIRSKYSYYRKIMILKEQRLITELTNKTKTITTEKKSARIEEDKEGQNEKDEPPPRLPETLDEVDDGTFISDSDEIVVNSIIKDPILSVKFKTLFHHPGLNNHCPSWSRDIVRHHPTRCEYFHSDNDHERCIRPSHLCWGSASSNSADLSKRKLLNKSIDVCSSIYAIVDSAFCDSL